MRNDSFESRFCIGLIVFAAAVRLVLAVGAVDAAPTDAAVQEPDVFLLEILAAAPEELTPTVTQTEPEILPEEPEPVPEEAPDMPLSSLQVPAAIRRTSRRFCCGLRRSILIRTGRPS